jgi:hypothetical protein
MTLVGDKRPLVFQISVRLGATGPAQRQSHGSRVNATSRRLSAGLLAVRFLSRAAPKARPYLSLFLSRHLVFDDLLQCNVDLIGR